VIVGMVCICVAVRVREGVWHSQGLDWCSIRGTVAQAMRGERALAQHLVCDILSSFRLVKLASHVDVDTWLLRDATKSNCIRKVCVCTYGLAQRLEDSPALGRLPYGSQRGQAIQNQVSGDTPTE
jgi:hypothetical protein